MPLLSAVSGRQHRVGVDDGSAAREATVEVQHHLMRHLGDVRVATAHNSSLATRDLLVELHVVLLPSVAHRGIGRGRNGQQHRQAQNFDHFLVAC
jgi:hypothetical protein